MKTNIYISFLFEISKLQTVASGGMMQKVCLFPKNCLAADAVEDVEHLRAQVIPSFITGQFGVSIYGVELL